MKKYKIWANLPPSPITIRVNQLVNLPLSYETNSVFDTAYSVRVCGVTRPLFGTQGRVNYFLTSVLRGGGESTLKLLLSQP